ncbi:magnesium transporter [Methanofollis fontis]|uniref:Magnesium transporter MgtE n=1 Tax=Methanofollis fontis TaxID=2052832 RepID=A0A483CTJ3_9EURY|nr:magnesium transporter [Methanofollis fontis]TAJ44693.1 magnesium transporter MgtE [Methanofollis fontis]
MAVGAGRERRLFLTGLAALVFSTIAAVLAGSYLSSVSDLLILIPGLMVLVPPTINMRGSISGVLASRISSSMHLGEFTGGFEGDGVLLQNLHASLLLTIATSVALGLIAPAVSALIGIPVIAAADLVLISVLAGLVSGLIVMGFTVLIAVLSYRRSVDMDMIAAPAVTTLGDLVTIPALALAAPLVLSVPEGGRGLLLIAVLLGVALLSLHSWRRGERVHEVVGEVLPLLIPLLILGTFAGVTYSAGLERLVTTGALLILIPPFAGICGSIGGILCSRIGTGMHLGVIDPEPVPSRAVGIQFAWTYLYTLILLPLMATCAHIAALLMGVSSPGLLTMVTIATLAGAIVMTLVNGIAYLTAMISFRYGYDPDNFGIPVITSSIDLLGAVALMSVISLFLI